MTKNELLLIKNIGEKFGYNKEVLAIFFTKKDPGNEFIYKEIMKAIDEMTGEEHLFNASRAIQDQFLHGDCYMLAEHLLYSLHGEDDIEVDYIILSEIVSVHGLVNVKYKGVDNFIDAGGIYKTLDGALKKYGVTEDYLVKETLTGESVVDECDSDGISKLTSLTSTIELASLIDNELDYGHGDLCDLMMNNLFYSIVKGGPENEPSLIDN